MDFGAIHVDVPPLPEAPSDEEDAALELIRDATAQRGLLGRLVHRTDEGEALKAADHALEAAERRLARLVAFGEEMLFRLGEAWLDAGAPGKPAMKEQLEVRLEAEEREYHARFAKLMSQRYQLLVAVEHRDDATTTDKTRLLERSMQLETFMDACGVGLQIMDSQGLFHALDHLEKLPEDIKRGIPRQNLGRLRAWTRELQKRIATDQSRLEVQLARLQTKRVRQMRQGVEAETRVLDQVKGLHDGRERSAEDLRVFLVGVGRKLVPHAHTFRNGEEAAGILHDSKALHQDTTARIAELTERRAALIAASRPG